MTKPIDKVVLLGKRKTSVGIATQPAVAPEGDRPAVIILNTGIVHRVGHNRMYVTLSRELAEIGHVVLRIDLSGLGDSEPRSDILDPLAASLADVEEAIDWLVSARGASSVILLGLCSGADLSIAYAGGDPRVAGLILLDPTVPRTPRFYLTFIGSRLVRGESWELVRKFFSKMTTTAPPDELTPRQVLRKDPRARQFLENAYKRAVQGKNELLAIFTAGQAYQHNYRRQLLDAMHRVRFGNQLQLEYFARCDHTFTFASDRKRLFDMIKTWLQTTTFTSPAIETLSKPAEALAHRD